MVSHGHFLRYLVFPVPKAFDRDGCNGENCIRTFHGKYLDGQWLSNPLPSLPFNRFNRIAFLQTVLKYDFGTKNSIWTKSISLNLGAKIHAYKFSYLNFQTTVEILEQCVSPVGKKGPFFRLATTNCFTYTIEVFPRLLSLFMERKIRLGWKPIFSLFLVFSGVQIYGVLLCITFCGKISSFYFPGWLGRSKSCISWRLGSSSLHTICVVLVTLRR